MTSTTHDDTISKDKGRLNMTVTNLKIGNRKFVVVPERDFDRLRKESSQYRQIVEEDRVLGELAEKELKAYRKSGGGTPWAQIKRGVGL
jgi:hypothetical protein